MLRGAASPSPRRGVRHVCRYTGSRTEKTGVPHFGGRTKSGPKCALCDGVQAEAASCGAHFGAACGPRLCSGQGVAPKCGTPHHKRDVHPLPARPVRFCLTLPRGRAIVYVLQVSRLGAGMKREAGAIPARSRRCDRPTGPHDATVLPQGREGAGARRAVSQKTCLRWLRASSRERQRSRTGPMAIGTPRLCRSCDAAVIVALASLGEGGVFCCPAGAGTPWTVPGDRPVGQQTSPS